jgi:hypothetical protein
VKIPWKCGVMMKAALFYECGDASKIQIAEVPEKIVLKVR